MERYCLRHADRLLWPGGDVLGTYRRFYARSRSRRPVEIPDAFLVEQRRPARRRRREREGPLQLIYVGRMERRKGVDTSLRALTSMEYEAWALSLLGGDTRHRTAGDVDARDRRGAIAGDARIDAARPGAARPTSPASMRRTTPSSSPRAGSAGRTRRARRSSAAGR